MRRRRTSDSGLLRGDTTYYGNDADNKYNALQVKAEKRVSNGLQFLAHYTFSHAYAYDNNYYSVNKTLLGVQTSTIAIKCLWPTPSTSCLSAEAKGS